MTETVLISLYTIVGLYFVGKSQSRGFIADSIFFLAWPYFLLRHYVKGY